MPEQSPTLRDMINAALADGTTYRELEARAIDKQTGKRASRSIFFDIATGKLDRMPYEHHLRAIAAALRTPYAAVRQAAITQYLPSDADTTPSEPMTDAERQELRAEILRLRAEAERTSAMTDEALAQALARIDRQTGERHEPQPKSA